MKKYEYKTFDIGMKDFTEPKKPHGFEEILNKEGAEGWRYIETVIQIGGGTTLRFLVVLEREVNH